MPRVTALMVQEIIDTELSESRVKIFIAGASKMVDNTLVGKGLDEDTLIEIERWLAAHNIAATFERQAIHEKAGPAEQRFPDIFGQGLLSTTWGQMAVALDTTGTLQDIADRRRMIKFKAIPE